MNIYHNMNEVIINEFLIRVTLALQEYRVVEDLKDQGYTYIQGYYINVVPKMFMILGSWRSSRVQGSNWTKRS